MQSEHEEAEAKGSLWVTDHEFHRVQLSVWGKIENEDRLENIDIQYGDKKRSEDGKARS